MADFWEGSSSLFKRPTSDSAYYSWGHFIKIHSDHVYQRLWTWVDHVEYPLSSRMARSSWTLQIPSLLMTWTLLLSSTLMSRYAEQHHQAILSHSLSQTIDLQQVLPAQNHGGIMYCITLSRSSSFPYPTRHYACCMLLPVFLWSCSASIALAPVHFH